MSAVATDVRSPEALTPEALLDEIRSLSGRINRARRYTSRLTAQRAEAFRAARFLDPPISLRVLAGAAGITDGGVVQAMAAKGSDADRA